MLIKLTIRNFKRFENVEIELGNPVVFIGPNNSGKTSAIQKHRQHSGRGENPRNMNRGAGAGRADIMQEALSPPRQVE